MVAEPIPVVEQRTDEVRPRAEDEAVELYVRTYSTILRTSGSVPVRAFFQAHRNVDPSLHPGASAAELDAGALIYAVNRLPAAISRVRQVVMGQLPEDFARALHSAIERWEPVQAPARRRQWHYDGQETLAVHVASISDVDDVIPTLVALQIEWNKLHALLNRGDRSLRRILAQPEPRTGDLERVRRHVGLSADDWHRLGRRWGEEEFWAVLRAVTAAEKDLSVRLLGGTHVGYAKLTRRWWQHIAGVLDHQGLSSRPVYFVSSNLHSAVNLVSGYARRRADLLWAFLRESGARDPAGEAAALVALRGQANAENVLYYASRLWHGVHSDPLLKQERAREEAESGILTVPPIEGADVGTQVIELGRLRPEDFDPRLADLAGAASASDAVILNVDYPLGMAAYHILRQVAEAADTLLGVYVLGKAATLNGEVGDVMISDLVYDEHTCNTYSFENAFAYDDVAPYMDRGAVLDNQRAVTVKGTFLQNRAYLDRFYRESYTAVEMESGPYLSALYEATQINRYPLRNAVHLRRLPMDLGIIHYGSDTPYTRARTLGGRSLSFEGVDATYASAVAILRRILTLEAHRRAPVRR